LEIDTLTHRQRLESVVAFTKPDRTPVALWRHFPVDDQTPDSLAAATAHFQRTFDFDLIKVTPASSFCLKDLGCRDEWQGNPEGTRTYTRTAIHHPEDWRKLKVLDPRKGHLGQQLECLNLLIKEFSDSTPILQSIFNPLSQAKNLAGSSQLMVHLHKYPEAVEAGLKIITLNTLGFIEELLKTGIDGIFYAIQHAQYELLTETEFARFSIPYDQQILAAVKPLWLNMAHLHGENVMFDTVANYPVQVLNWHDRHTQPDLAAASTRYSGIVCGGLSRVETMVLGTPADVNKEARKAFNDMGGKNLILGTGCVVPVTAPYGNYMAARRFVAESSLSA